jgi:hypothetical protein
LAKRGKKREADHVWQTYSNERHNWQQHESNKHNVSDAEVLLQAASNGGNGPIRRLIYVNGEFVR